MIAAHPRALFQAFLPNADQQAFVWKYAESVGGRRPRHFHAEPELNVVVRGSATFGVAGSTVQVCAGDLLTFPSGQDHVLLEASPDLYLYAIGLERAFSAEVLRTARDAVVPLHVRLSEQDSRHVLARAADAVDRLGAEQTVAELWQRIFWLCRRATPRNRRGTHVLTRRTLQLMHAEPELGLEQLAEKLRAGPSEVSRHFHGDLRMTLVRYRARQRILRLVQLLDGGRADLMSAASAAGFGSYSQCHRTFRAELGCTPREFFRSDLRTRMQSTYAG